MAFVTSLLLLLAANGTPIMARKLLGRLAGWPVDGGLRFIDQQPLFGEAKTWRGIAAAITGCLVMALLLGLPGWVGAAFGAWAMLGDLLSSFLKRRLGIVPSGRATGLDQLPEALLPLWLLREELSLGPAGIAILVLLFFVLEQWLSRLLYRWHIRNRPY